MPVGFLTDNQKQRYGRYAGEPTKEQLARYFHLDDADLLLVRQRRSNHNRLGFALQLCTVRFLGTFLSDPTIVPTGVVAYVVTQLGITDSECLPRYLIREATHREHAGEIQQYYGYRDFSEQPEHWQLVRWLYGRAWVSAEAPSVLFDMTTARLVERKILLPGVTALERLVASVRERVANRLWRTLSKLPSAEQLARLEALLVVNEQTRQTPLDQLRRSPTRYSAPALIDALNRLVKVRQLGVSNLDIRRIPPNRVKALARMAIVVRVQTIARMPLERRIATLVAFARVIEATATDDAIDVLELLIKDLLTSSARDGKKQRLRTLKDLDAAALQLSTACAILLDLNCDELTVRESVFQRIPKPQLALAVAKVEELARPPEDNYYQELLERWRAIRRFLPTLLCIIDFQATEAGFQ